MIYSLTGKIKDTASQLVVIDVAGVGFAVGVPNDTIFITGQITELQIYFHWNQENGPQLFGFISNLEKTIFAMIISCSGFGPKIGLAVLANLGCEQFMQAIILGDAKTLSSISGIGAKKAEMLITILKDKVAKITPKETKTPEGATLIKVKDISDALYSLKYSRSEVTSALDYIKKECALESVSFDELLRKSLTHLAKRI